jgi:hypothetical protein
MRSILCEQVGSLCGMQDLFLDVGAPVGVCEKVVLLYCCSQIESQPEHIQSVYQYAMMSSCKIAVVPGVTAQWKLVPF